MNTSNSAIEIAHPEIAEVQGPIEPPNLPNAATPAAITQQDIAAFRQILAAAPELLASLTS